MLNILMVMMLVLGVYMVRGLCLLYVVRIMHDIVDADITANVNADWTWYARLDVYECIFHPKHLLRWTPKQFIKYQKKMHPPVDTPAKV